jgi:stalled ribosome rescue protein Dom34
MQHIIEDVFDEIQASNMSKLGEDGKPLLREDGKILKGPGFFKPDLTKFIKVDTDESNNI